MSSQLEEALAVYRDSLPRGRTEMLRIDGSDYLGIPIYNVDLFTPDFYYSGIGYGANETEALVGAYGELVEDCHLQLSFPCLAQRTASYAELVAAAGVDAVLDPLTLVLPAGSDYRPERLLRWVQIERLRDGAAVWCPAEFVVSGDWELPDYDNKLTTCISNGTGAGDTKERAVLHALLELLQRDGNADSFRALDRGQVIDPATVSASVREILEYLQNKGVQVTLKLARVTCGCASVYAVGDDVSSDNFGLSATACGEAADPDVNRALRKAVLECASSHSRKRFNNMPFKRLAGAVPDDYFDRIRASIDLDQEEERALRAMVEFVGSDKKAVRQRLANSVFSHHTTVAAPDLPQYADEDIGARLDYVLKRLADAGMEPYVFSAPTTGGDCYAVKVVVPHMEMEFGSYHRIGYRGVERLLERDPFNLLSRQVGPGNALIRLTEALDRKLGGPFYLNTARLDALIEPLYGLYREPTAHAAPIALEQNYFSGKPTNP